MTRGLGAASPRAGRAAKSWRRSKKRETCPKSELPSRDRPPEQLRAPSAVVDLLRTLLRLKAEQAGVAARLVANAEGSTGWRPASAMSASAGLAQRNLRE